MSSIRCQRSLFIMFSQGVRIKVTIATYASVLTKAVKGKMTCTLVLKGFCLEVTYVFIWLARTGHMTWLYLIFKNTGLYSFLCARKEKKWILMIRTNDLHRPQGWTGTSHLRTEGIKFLEKEIALEKALRWERCKCFEDKKEQWNL